MKGLLLVVLSVLVLMFFLHQFTGLQEIVVQLTQVDVKYLPFIVAIPFLIVSLAAFRWRTLLRSVGVDAGFRTVLKYVLIGNAFNNVTPMIRFGGEPVKGYLISQDLSASKNQVFASLALDSFVTMITLLSVIYFAIMSIPMTSIVDFNVLWFVLFLLLLPLTVGGYFIYDEGLLKRAAGKAAPLVARFSRKSARSLPKEALKFRKNMSVCVRDKGVMLSAFASSYAERLLEILCIYVIFISMGIDIGIFKTAVALGVGLLSGLIPLFPGGLVAYESFTIVALGMLGVKATLAATGILMWRGVSYWLFTFIGMGMVWVKGIKMSIKK